MAVDITIPSPGESITEVVLGPWHKADGDWVERDEILVEIESDKVTLEVPAESSGVLKITAGEGDEMEVGQVIGSIDEKAMKPATVGASAATEQPAEATRADSTPGSPGSPTDPCRATPVARKIAADKGIDLGAVPGSGPAGRIMKSDVMAASATPGTAAAPTNGTKLVAPDSIGGTRNVRREKMSRLRQRIAERLVSAQHEAAMLTTFNEVDMTAVMTLRKRHKEEFADKHGVNLGFMSFFIKACVSALEAHPLVNAYIVDKEVEYHDYADVSVAVGTDKGLVVPVLRNVEMMSFAGIEKTIKDLALRARDGKLSLDEMTGGTFTISNGGVYGSLNSTPILNPPQSGILGMHKIMNRAVEDSDNPGQIALRPMMYLALSYDHRIVDGAGAVGFLVHVKNCIENPERMLFGI